MAPDLFIKMLQNRMDELVSSYRKVDLSEESFAARKIIDTCPRCGYDEGHSEEETRFQGMAIVDGLSVVVSCYTERGRIRIISARRATASERRMYYERLRSLYS